MNKELKTTLKGYAFISPWIIGFSLFLIIPIVLSFYYSFCDYDLLRPPAYIGLQNYRDLYHDALFWKVLKNTLMYAAISIPCGLLVALGLALLLNVKIPAQPLFRTVIFLPSLVPVIASAMIWLWLLNAKLGLISNLFRALGLHGTISLQWLNNWFHISAGSVDAYKDIQVPPLWLDDTRFALPSLAFMSLWGVGYTVVIYLAGLQDVPKELYEAAEIDGATAWRRLWHVTLPTLSPVIFFNLIMAIIGTFQVFAIPYVMTGGGPNDATNVYTMDLYNNAFTYLKMGYASALAWIQLLIILILTGIAFWSSRRWVHYQGR